MIKQFICISICNATLSPILIASKPQVKRKMFQTLFYFKSPIT